MRRTVVVVVVASLVLVAWPTPAVALRLTPPVDGPVLQQFDAPTRFGAGHRGVDLGAPVGTPVGASAPGAVSFAGSVVGARWVTVDHGGLRTTVGPLTRIDVVAGQRVGRGTVLGTSGRAHGTPAVHWSLRRGDVYLDPLAGGAVATLVPGPVATDDGWTGRPPARYRLDRPGALHRAFARSRVGRPSSRATTPHVQRRVASVSPARIPTRDGSSRGSATLRTNAHAPA